MKFKSKEEIMNANMDAEECETVLRLFEEEQNLNENCKMILEHFKKLNE